MALLEHSHLRLADLARFAARSGKWEVRTVVEPLWNDTGRVELKLLADFVEEPQTHVLLGFVVQVPVVLHKLWLSHLVQVF